MRGDDGARSAGETTASKAALLEDAHSDGDASPASQAALLEPRASAIKAGAGRTAAGTKPPPRCASPRSSSHAALLEDVALDDETPAADHDAAADGGCCCCRNERCTNHAKVLTVALVLFLSITCAQFGLALLARSNTHLVTARRCSSNSAT